MSLLTDNQGAMPSVILDPFKDSCIEAVRLTIRRGFFSDERNMFFFEGRIEFKNGATTGEQSFKENSFNELVTKIQATLETLKRK